MKSFVDSRSDANVKFVITGFGPFSGVPHNPTSVLVKRLKDHACSFGVNIVDALIFEVSASSVKKSVDEIFYCLNNLVNQSQNQKNRYSLIHLGVAHDAKHIQLEKYAYNDATFRIPDIDGYKPYQECIVESLEHKKFGDTMETKLNLENLCRGCSSNNSIDDDEKQEDLVVHISSDPGRYVCNYTYFYSLSKASMADQSKDNKGFNSKLNVDVLFVHVPPFAVVNEERQFKFVLDLLQSISEQYED